MNEIKVQAALTSMLTIALSHNAAVTELATMALAQGPLKQSSYKRVHREFQRVHEKMNKSYKEALKQFEKYALEGLDDESKK